MNTAEQQTVGWKGRGNLAKLVAELQRQKESRIDFVADTRSLIYTAQSDGKRGTVTLGPGSVEASEWLTDGPVTFNEKALAQLAERSDPSIPKRFMDEMLVKRPNRLTALLNGLHTDAPAKRLVRCLDGKVRGWLSDRYRVIDNFDMAFQCLDTAQRFAGQVIEASLSDTRMRIKFTSAEVWDAIDLGQTDAITKAGSLGNHQFIGRTLDGSRFKTDLPGGPGTIHPLVTISNSETGHGGFSVQLGVLMGACFNGVIIEDVVRQIHLGERLDEGIFSHETLAADSKSLMLKARDAVIAAFDKEKFKTIAAKCREAQTDVIEKPTAAVENVMELGGISEEKKEALLSYFLRDYDQTRFGLAQAVSRLAQDTDDADEGNDLESFAGQIMRTKQLVTA